MKIGLGGSCHWCTEAIFKSLSGVTSVEQGWISSIEQTDFSEAVIIHYDENIISLQDLIEIHLHTHSCTSTHSMRDKYRSAVYTYNKKQRQLSIQTLQQLKLDFPLPIITRVLSFLEFKINKEKYLDYYYRNPEKAFCKNQIDPKLKKLIGKFSSKVDRQKLKLK